MAGAFITFEGVDGCGKTSQMRELALRIAARYPDRGLSCEATREPGGTPLGSAIRALVVDHRAESVAPEAELLLFAADRAQHVHAVVRPALEAGAVVLCDRYTDATVAFQGYGRGLDLETIESMNRAATGGLTPDLTLLFDVDVDEAARRLAARAAASGAEPPNRFDEEARAFHERVRAGYLRLHEADPARIRVVDARGSFEEVARAIDRLVLPLVEERCLSAG